jgi:hypothetical protein
MSSSASKSALTARVIVRRRQERARVRLFLQRNRRKRQVEHNTRIAACISLLLLLSPADTTQKVHAHCVRCTSHSAGNFFLRIESALRTCTHLDSSRNWPRSLLCSNVYADWDCNGTKVMMRIQRLKVIILWRWRVKVNMKTLKGFRMEEDDF